MTLTKKLTVFVFMAGLPTAAVFLIVTLSFAYFVANDAISQQQYAAAKQIMRSIDQDLSLKQNQLSNIAKSSDLAAALITKDAQQLSRHRASLQEAARISGQWQQMKIVDLNGKAVVALDSAISAPFNPANQPPWQMVFDQAVAGEEAYSDVFIDNTTNQPAILFASPMTEISGKVRGVIIASLSWQIVVDVINGHERVELFNAKSQLLGSSKTKDTAILQAPIDNALLKKAMSGAESTEVVRGAEDVLISYTRQKGHNNYGGSGWVLLIETPASTAFAAIIQVTPWLVGIFLAIVIVIATGLVFAVAHAFVTPVRQLTAATQKISLGDLTQRVKVSSKDEFGALAKTFNNMADTLQQVYRGLEKKIQDKTAELGQKVREVEAEKAKDEALLKSIGEGMIAIDDTGAILKINQPAITILGLPDQNHLSKKLKDTLKFFDERDVELPADKWAPLQALTTGNPAEQLFVVHRQEGKALVAVLVNPIIQNDKTIGAIMVMRDVTKEKEVDRMKTEFISLASHQLRTPLSAIKWFTEMLASGDAGKLKDEQAEFVKNITDSTERMIELVNSLLNISRIESGRIIIDPKPTDLSELVNGIVNDLKGKTAERQQTLIVSVHKDLPKVNLDSRLIGQVFLNLLTNAIKYTPKGGEISVFVSRRDDQLVSQVSDNGFGIPKSEQSKVFQKFFRAGNVVKIETDGTGLGLYLIKAIIESSGGKIWFESAEGKGTSFWFSLPMTGMKAKEGEVTLDA